MAGTEIIEAFQTPSRRLHAKGTLGFHAPFLQVSAGTYDKIEIDNSFKAGILALAELLALEPDYPHAEFFRKELIVEMSRRGPNEVFLIDTVRKAIKFDIEIYGLREPSQITRRMICNACGNVNPISQFNGCISENEVKVMPTKDGVEFSAQVPGAEGYNNTCSVVTGRVGSLMNPLIFARL